MGPLNAGFDPTRVVPNGIGPLSPWGWEWMDHPPRIEKRMPRGYCGFVGENLGTKHLESFAASLKMLHLFDNLGLVDIILYICILCVYIYICVCGCVCVCACVFMFEPCRNWETFYTIHKFLWRSGPWPLLAVSFGTSFLLFDLFRSCGDSDAHIPIYWYTSL